MHLDPINGLGVDAAKQFAKAGGTHIIMVGKTARDWGLDGLRTEDFIDSYQRTIDFAEKVSRETDAEAFPVVGFHPSEFIGMSSVLGIESACRIAQDVAEVLEGLYLERKIYGIGEVGRPHYAVSEELWERSNVIMEDFLSLSARIGCPLQLHTEHFDKGKYDELSGMIKRCGNPKKVIKHFSPPMPLTAERSGVYPSIVSSKDSILTSISESSRFLMETDYIDDSSRPGAVLGPKTVPKRTLDFLEKGIFTEDDVARIHEDLVEEIYGIEFH